MSTIDFIVLKINGIDVQRLHNNDEAVQMFLNHNNQTTNEKTILIEVVRKCDQRLHDRQATNYNIKNPINSTYNNVRGYGSDSDDYDDILSRKIDQLKIQMPATITSTIEAKNINTKMATVSAEANNFRRDCTNPLGTTITTNSSSTTTTVTACSTGTTPVQKISNEIILTLKLTGSTETKSSSAQTENFQCCCYYYPIQTTEQQRHRHQSQREQLQHRRYYSHPHHKQYHTHIQHQQHAAIMKEIGSFKHCLAPDIGTEEITLHKSDSDERLGLTVCFSNSGSCSVYNNDTNHNSNNNISNDNDFINSGALNADYQDDDGDGNNGVKDLATTAIRYSDDTLITLDDSLAPTPDATAGTDLVHISGIQPHSIAARDGRVRQSDQILEINGKDVQNTQKTEDLIAENNNTVTLLVSRYLYAGDNYNNHSIGEGLDTINNADAVDIGDCDDDTDVVVVDDDDRNVDEDNDIDCIIDDDEDDVEGDMDDIDDEYFDEHQSSAYENCYLSKNSIHNARNDVLLCQQEQQNEASINNNINMSITNNLTTNVATTKIQSLATVTPTVELHGNRTKSYQHLTGTPLVIKTMPFAVSSTSTTTLSTAAATQKEKSVTNITSSASTIATNSNIEYETEHIYETIPEDSEPEPFYCSPYESSTYVTTEIEGGGACDSINSYLTTAAARTTTSATQNHHDTIQQKHHCIEQWLGIKSSTMSMTMIMPLTKTTVIARQSLRNNSNHNNMLLQQQYNAVRCKQNSAARSTLCSGITTLINGLTSSSGDGRLDDGVAVTDGSGTCMLIDNNLATTPTQKMLDEQENSSSAYNTGGSNNSIATPFVLMLQHQQRPNIDDVRPNVDDTITTTAGGNGVIISTSSGNEQSKQSFKEKYITSPKNKSAEVGGGGANFLRDFQFSEAITRMLHTTATVALKGVTQQQQPLCCAKQISSKDMHLHQKPMSIKIQQQHQPVNRQQHSANYCPTTSTQFTAPNLSQYHFVSSQEVSAAAHISRTQHNFSPATTTATLVAMGDSKGSSVGGVDGFVPKSTASTEGITMVWKVKRRPDGTRYIVRRPAPTDGADTIATSRAIVTTTTTARRNRLISSSRERSARVRNNITTTEEDTISEVKTGRYWSKEDRKKHIERARERRLMQQQNLHVFTSQGTMRIKDKTIIASYKMQHPQQQQQQTQQKEQCKLLLQEQYTHIRKRQQSPNVESSTVSARRTAASQKQHHYQFHFNSLTTATTTSKQHQQSNIVAANLHIRQQQQCVSIDSIPQATTINNLISINADVAMQTPTEATTITTSAASENGPPAIIADCDCGNDRGGTKNISLSDTNTKTENTNNQLLNDFILST